MKIVIQVITLKKPKFILDQFHQKFRKQAILNPFLPITVEHLSYFTQVNLDSRIPPKGRF